jgi:hypothetical protein
MTHKFCALFAFCNIYGSNVLDISSFDVIDGANDGTIDGDEEDDEDEDDVVGDVGDDVNDVNDVNGVNGVPIIISGSNGPFVSLLPL